MLKSSVEKITPKMAKEYLKFNTNNYRKLSRATVLKYAEDMKNGLWKLNGEAIEFDEDGTLVNGQHRLAAIIYSNMTVEVLVVRGVGKEDSNIYDNGSVRTINQIAAAEGLDVNPTITSAANIIVHGFSGKAKSKTATIEYIRENEPELNRAYRAANYGGNDKSRTAPCLAASYLMLRTQNIRYYELELFWRLYNQPMITQYDGYDPSPVFIAYDMMEERRKASAGRQIQKERLEILVRSMTDFHNGDSVIDKYKLGEPFVFDKLLKQVRKQDGLEAK